MIWFALLLAAMGLFLSAFFSGSETGFYRIPRVRLRLDALGGDPIARGLLWLTNRPSIFVATTLTGNNVANYLTSLAIVMAVQASPMGQSYTAELLAPILLAPFLFVYGELLPKYLFLNAPRKLLRRGSPLFLVCVVLFAPISLLLGALDKVLQKLVRRSPEQVKLALVRRELQQVLEEGHDVGILRPHQFRLARGIFAVAKQPVARFVEPLAHVPRARSDAPRAEILQLARRYRIANVAVEDATRPGHLTGYVRVIDLCLESSSAAVPIRPLLEIAATDMHLTALTKLEDAEEPLARVLDVAGETIGLVTAKALRESLLAEGRLC
ncbi:MAG: DUF21 domain-containing protein [Planctomycetes bacterium]|nr:DUF21 domain-containing protein [Planctomycetota bacterium]